MAKKETPKKATLKEAPKVKSESPYFSYIITSIFLLVAGLGIMHHEMWRDELQAWLVAADAHSLSELHNNLKYEGNPILWHSLLYILSSFTSNPASMQVLHILIATGFVFIFNKYAPFNSWIKILFTFGYYAIYEYSVISRSYGLGLLMIFAVCALYKNREKYYLHIGALLFLLANDTIYGLLFSVAFSGLLIIDHYFSKNENKKQYLNKLLICVSAATVGVILGYLQIKPEADNSFPVSYPIEPFEWLRLRYGMAQLFKSFFPIPDMKDPYYWNTSMFFSQTEDKINSPYLPFVLLIVCLIQFIKKPKVGLFYTGLTLVLLFLIYYSLLTFNRYVGHLFIAYICANWLGHYYEDENYSNPILNKLAGFGTKLRPVFLIATLVLNIIAGLMVYMKDWKGTFSYSKQAAEYIKENKLDTLTIVGSTDFVMGPIAAFLNKPIYFPEMDDFGSFTKWNSKRKAECHFPEIVNSLNFLLQKNNQVLLVMSEPPNRVENGQKIILDHDIISTNVKADLLKAYPKGAEKNEAYYIYMITKLGPIPSNTPTQPDKR